MSDPIHRLAPTIAPLDLSPRRVFDRVSALGFRAVQLSAAQPGLRPRELGRSARRDLIASLRRRELALAGLDLWIPVSHFADPSQCDRAAGAVIAAIDLAADLGRASLSMLLPPSEGETGAIVEHLALHATTKGVVLADFSFPVSDENAVGIDTAAWLAGAADPAEGIVRLGPRLAALRVVDLLSSGMRGPIGERDGRLDLVPIVAAIDVAGYTDAIVIDTRQWVDPWTGLERTLAAWPTLPT